MKTFFFTISKKAAVLAALVVLVVAPMQPLVAQAQVADNPVVDNALTQQSQAAVQNSAQLSQTQPATTAQNPAANNTQPVPSSNCALASGGSWGSSGDWAQCITDVVYVFTVGIGSGFAYVSAYFFDWAVALSLNGSAYALDFVSQGWATARDLANMTFLFILLYIAFKIMFEADTSGTVHMLTLVIVIALLVNFSFFFTRLAIDAGNILAIQFYNAIDVPSVATTAGASGVQGSVLSGLNAVTPGANLAGGTKDLTAGIMQMLNLQGLLGTDSFQKFRTGTNYNFLTTLISLSFLYIAAGIMLWGLTVAFITNGVKFLVRIVVLWFLIIASPLAFAARAVPKFESYYKKWQDALITHAFYPVAFMFIFLILTNFAKQMSGQNGLIGGIFEGLNSTPSNTGYVAQMAIAVANVGIRMGFVLAMLYIGMKAAEKIGVMGADAANHAGNWVGGRLVGTYGRVGGVAGRYTAGLAGNTVASSAWARRMESKTGLTGLFGRGIRAGAGTLGSSSFDVRGAPGLRNVLPKEAGKAQVGGYNKALEENIKAKEKRAKSVEASEAQKAAARKTAEQETGYSKQKERFEDAKTKHDAANVRLQALIEGGRENDPEAKNLKDEVSTHATSMKAAQGRMKVLEDMTKQKAAAISGEGLSKVYAETMRTRNVRNLWIPFRASKEAAAKVKKGDSNEKKVLEAAKKAMKEAEEGEKGHGGGDDHAEPKKEEKGGGGGDHGGGH